MRYKVDHPIRRVSNGRLTMVGYLALCLVSLALLLFGHGCNKDIAPHDPNSALAHQERPAKPVSSETSPPDLSSCTRLEIRYLRSTLDYFLGHTPIQETVLSKEEREYIESIEFFTVSDPKRIAAFAHDVSSGTYWGNLGERRPMEMSPVGIRCYRNDEHIISFTVFSNLIVTEDNRAFRYPQTYPEATPNLVIIEPAEMQPFKLRFECALDMNRIYGAGPLYFSYPDPIKWCDIVMEYRTNTSYVSDEEMRGWFKCPGARKGKCHYALNPDCKLRSPRDTVLLFETKAGWNAHGGPELFTFDNHHDPRGGCVLLHNGTVKFIRTKEELQQLRWE